MSSAPAPTMQCPDCDKQAKLVDVGTATGRRYYRCLSCKKEWYVKNPDTVAAGAKGGAARAAAMSEEARSASASAAVKVRWKAEKARRNGGHEESDE